MGKIVSIDIKVGIKELKKTLARRKDQLLAKILVAKKALVSSGKVRIPDATRLAQKAAKLNKDTKRAVQKRVKTTRRALKPMEKKARKFVKGLTPIQRKNIVCLSILAVIGLGLGINVWHKNRPALDIDYSMALSESAALESHIFVGGDIYWGRRMNDWSQQSSLKEAYPFSKLDSFQRELYDAWIGNLECPSVPGIKQPIGFVPELWEFNCDTDYLSEAAKWFDIFSLANNHTQNQNREAGLEATRKELDKNGIQHFGNFNPHVKRDVCEVVAMPARAFLGGKQQEVRMPVALCGFHGVYYTITDESMAVMQEYAEVMPVLAFPHMGQEYQAIQDQRRRGLYQKMIDNGADAVIGNHPHWVQPTEVYKGKLIAYSMGNFIFDQDFSDEVMRSAAIDITLNVAKAAVSEDELGAWADLGDRCSSFQDDCLAEVKAQKLRRLPVTFNYGIVGVDTSNKVTKRANLRVYNGILERLNWNDTRQKLMQTSQ